MNAYWALGHDNGNFGDLLTPLIFQRIGGIDLTWTEREQAELFAIGSIAEMIPPGFSGFVLGTGSMFGAPLDLSSARVLALRGIHTANAACLRPPLLADLGLLAPDLLTTRPRRKDQIATFRTGGDPRPHAGTVLDPENGDPEALIALAARAEAIVSSSLHGLILADSLGIVNMWDPYLPADAGAGFKFKDYGSSFGENLEPFRWRLADQSLVGAKQVALRKCVAGIASEAR